MTMSSLNINSSALMLSIIAGVMQTQALGIKCSNCLVSLKPEKVYKPLKHFAFSPTSSAKGLDVCCNTACIRDVILDEEIVWKNGERNRLAAINHLELEFKRTGKHKSQLFTDKLSKLKQDLETKWGDDDDSEDYDDEEGEEGEEEEEEDEEEEEGSTTCTRTDSEGENGNNVEANREQEDLAKWNDFTKVLQDLENGGTKSRTKTAKVVDADEKLMTIEVQHNLHRVSEMSGVFRGIKVNEDKATFRIIGEVHGDVITPMENIKENCYSILTATSDTLNTSTGLAVTIIATNIEMNKTFKLLFSNIPWNLHGSKQILKGNQREQVTAMNDLFKLREVIEKTRKIVDFVNAVSPCYRKGKLLGRIKGEKWTRVSKLKIDYKKAVLKIKMKKYVREQKLMEYEHSAFQIKHCATGKSGNERDIHALIWSHHVRLELKYEYATGDEEVHVCHRCQQTEGKLVPGIGGDYPPLGDNEGRRTNANSWKPSDIKHYNLTEDPMFLCKSCLDDSVVLFTNKTNVGTTKKTKNLRRSELHDLTEGYMSNDYSCLRDYHHIFPVQRTFENGCARYSELPLANLRGTLTQHKVDQTSQNEEKVDESSNSEIQRLSRAESSGQVGKSRKQTEPKKIVTRSELTGRTYVKMQAQGALPERRRTNAQSHTERIRNKIRLAEEKQRAGNKY